MLCHPERSEGSAVKNDAGAPFIGHFAMVGFHQPTNLVDPHGRARLGGGKCYFEGETRWNMEGSITGQNDKWVNRLA